MNIVSVIREESRNLGDKLAIIEGDRSITYAQLLTRIAELAEQLKSKGITPGQRIAFRSSDGIDYVIGALAILASGGTVVPVADSLTKEEIRDTIERIQVHGILTHADMPHDAIDPPAEPIGETFNWQPRPPESSAESPLDVRCRDLGAAFIRFSSGTTGESKGVVLSHRSIVDRTDAANAGLQISERDTILWVLAMSHHFVVSILLFLRRGATIVVANKMFPFSMLEAVERNPITLIYGSPVHYYLLAMSDSVSPSALASMRMGVSTAMKMPADISAQFAKKFGKTPAEAYGIIEIGLPFINTDPGGAGQNTVGRVLPGYQLRIDHPDENGIGDIFIKGKGMFDAYFSPWRLREDCLHDGWFQTGDLGRLDETGRLALLGRSKTVIVCAGMKVFPEEVEEVIDSMPGVAESMVSGRDHPQVGQVPVAEIVLAPNSQGPDELLAELRNHCCQRLSSYKVPVEFRVTASLPKTPSGKLARSSARPKSKP